MGINKRIETFRLAQGMNRKEFAKELSVTVRIIEGIESEGISPKGEMLERFSEKWPEHILWLITGSISSKLKQKMPDFGNGKSINLIEIHDPRSMDQCVINKKYLLQGRVQFVQNLDMDCELGIVFYLDTKMTSSQCSDIYRNGALWLESGYLNLDSSHGGRNTLRDFREWLYELNGDLIHSAELVGINDQAFRRAERGLELFENDFKKVPVGKITERFIEWKEGGQYLWPNSSLGEHDGKETK